MPREKKATRLSLRINTNQMILIRAAAKATNRSITNFVMAACMERVEQTYSYLLWPGEKKDD